MTYVPKIMSGIDLIDASWDGMYQGGAYLCYGHASSGRGLLGMMFLHEGVRQNERCLLVSPGRPHDWMIQAASVNFDLKEARDTGKVRIVWIPSAFEDHGVVERDGARTMEEFIKVIYHHRPERIVINDFSPFLRFNSFERFQHAFVAFVKHLEQLAHTTLFLMMPAAVNKPSKQILDFMRNHMTGTIHIALDSEDGSENKRRVTLVPGIGHVSHAVFEHWEIPVTPVDVPRNGHRQQEPASTGENLEEKHIASSSSLQAGSLADIHELSAVDGAISVPDVALELIQKVELEHRVFCEHLKILFKERETPFHKPFLLVALRVEVGQSDLDEDIVFDCLLSVVQRMTEAETHALIDAARKRIVAFLMELRAGSVKNVVETLQHHLKEQNPEIADDLVRAVSAVVVPDGYPFESSEDFLAYALEGE